MVKPSRVLKRARNEPLRGEIWWLESEALGRRPVLILTRSTIVTALTGLVIAPVTRTVRNIDSEIVLDVEDGMRERCAASFDNLTTVPKAMLSERITQLSDVRLSEICSAIGFALDS